MGHKNQMLKQGSDCFREHFHVVQLALAGEMPDNLLDDLDDLLTNTHLFWTIGCIVVAC